MQSKIAKDKKRLSRAAQMALWLEAHQVGEPEKIKKLGDTIYAIAQTSQDDQVRLRAAQFLMDHDWCVFEHLNPATQKHEVSISEPIVIKSEHGLPLFELAMSEGDEK